MKSIEEDEKNEESSLAATESQPLKTSEDVDMTDEEEEEARRQMEEVIYRREALKREG